MRGTVTLKNSLNRFVPDRLYDGDRTTRRAPAELLTFGRLAREHRVFSFAALLTEGHAGQLCLELFLIFRIAGMRKAVGQLEEAFPFLLPGLDTGLDEINNDSVDARVAGLRQRFHAASDARGEAYALTDQLFGDRHGVRIHRKRKEVPTAQPGSMPLALITRAAAGVEYLRAFIRDIKASGLVA